MELPHRSLSSDDAWNIEAKLINTFFQVDENDIRKNLEAIPPSVNNYLTSVPDLR